MLSHDDITQQRALLAAHRKTLAVLLAQQAMHGDAYAPPSVLTGIDDARAAIERIEAMLREHNVEVDDVPDDDVPMHPQVDRAQLDASNDQTRSIGADNEPAINGDRIGGDNVGSDKVGGDKVGGDVVHGPKVAGDYVGRDKIDNRRGLFWDQARLPLLVVLLIVVTAIIIAVANLREFKGTLQDIDILPLDPTPAPTAEPLLFPIEQPGETLIVIAAFHYTAGNTDTAAHKEIRRAILAAMKPVDISNLRVEIAPTSLEAEDQAGAEQLGAHYHASIVVWGEDTGVRVTINFLNRRQPTFPAANVTINETERVQIAQPSAYAQFITHDLPAAMTFLALFAVGQSAYSRADYPAATRIISGALDALNGVSPLPQGTADAYFRLGWLYQGPGQDGPHAEVAYTRALALDPKDIASYYNRGAFYYDQGVWDKALADFNQALALDPKNAYAYIGRGSVYYTQGALDKALADFNQTLALNPKIAFAYYSRGNVYYKQGALDKALADLTQALALDPKLAAAYNNRGYIYYNQGALDQALADFNRAIALDPKLALAYNNRGLVYHDQGALDQALADYNQALALDPKYASAYNDRGLVYRDQGALDQALADFTQAISFDPKLAQAYNDRGIVYYDQGALDQALADHTQAISLDAKLAAAYYNRGLVHQAGGEREAAIIDFRQARTLSQNAQDRQEAADRLKELGAP